MHAEPRVMRGCWRVGLLGAGQEGVIVRRASARSSASTSDLQFGSMVPADPLSIAFVRHAMQSFSEVCGGEKAGDLALVFTELVTNSIRHAGLCRTDPIEVRLTLGHDGLSGAVVDTGPGFDPNRLGPLPTRTGGFGLFIVERLTKRWGVDLSHDTTTVWFEM